MPSYKESEEQVIKFLNGYGYGEYHYCCQSAVQCAVFLARGSDTAKSYSTIHHPHYITITISKRFERGDNSQLPL